MEGNCRLICWHPDGRQVLLSSDLEGGGKQALFLVDADGTGEPRRAGADVNPDDARRLVRLSNDVGLISISASSVYLTHLEGDPRTQRLSGVGEAGFAHPALSPDGRWLAYDVDVSGKQEVYVHPFPAGNGSWQISRGGGETPTWSPDGSEVVYQRKQGNATHTYSARLSVTPHGISAGSPRELFQVPTAMWLAGFHPDGRRRLAAKIAPPQFVGDRVVEILNWFDQVQERVSGK